MISSNGNVKGQRVVVPDIKHTSTPTHLPPPATRALRLVTLTCRDRRCRGVASSSPRAQTDGGAGNFQLNKISMVGNPWHRYFACFVRWKTFECIVCEKLCVRAFFLILSKHLQSHAKLTGRFGEGVKGQRNET